MVNIISRRKFLTLAGAMGATAIYKSLTPSTSMFAYAAQTAQASSIGQTPVLIVLNARGGWSHNIAPLYHGAYRDKMPTLSYAPEDSLPLNFEQGLHPALTNLKSIYDEGNLALINGVGYPQVNRSHDESETLMFLGAQGGLDNSMSAAVAGGWAARLTCQSSSIFSGISLGGSTELIEGACNPPRSFGDLSNFGESSIRWDDRRSLWMRQHRDALIAQGDGTSAAALSTVRNNVNNIEASISTVRAVTQRPFNFTFPNTSLGAACRDAVKLINAPELGTQFIYLSKGGFDTHSGELASLNTLLADIDTSLAAMVAALKSLGHYSRVTIMSISEFSRTFENNSQGTDHGHAGPMFVLGGRVQGGVKSQAYSAAETTGDYYGDYRVHYSQAFKDWTYAAGFDAERVFPRAIPNPQTLNLFTSS